MVMSTFRVIHHVNGRLNFRISLFSASHLFFWRIETRHIVSFCESRFDKSYHLANHRFIWRIWRIILVGKSRFNVTKFPRNLANLSTFVKFDYYLRLMSILEWNHFSHHYLWLDYEYMAQLMRTLNTIYNR